MFLVARDFAVLSNESTDEGERSQMSVFVHFVDVQIHKPVECFQGMVLLTTSKKTANFFLTILLWLYLGQKASAALWFVFVGWARTNAISGKWKGLQRRIHHNSPFLIYINSKSHWLALCLRLMIARYHTLVELNGMLLSVWKLLHYSSIKQTILSRVRPWLKFN